MVTNTFPNRWTKLSFFRQLNQLFRLLNQGQRAFLVQWIGKVYVKQVLAGFRTVSNTINRHQELRILLESLKLAGMAASFTDLVLKAAKEGLTHEAYLHELAKREEAVRQERQTERLLRQSGLPLEKTFRTFDL
jgi:IstB-like ATP binding protein